MANKTRLTTTAGALTAIALLAISFVGAWEGLRLNSYRDVVGVWTVCYGETKGVRGGQRYTKEQCDKMFVDSGLKRHERALLRSLNNPYEVPEKTYVAMLSLAYNIGEGGFARSSVVKRWNRGDRYGACEAFKYWNKAGGRVIKGLVNRRRAEMKLCKQGLSEPVTLVNPKDVPVAERPTTRRGYRGRWVRHIQELLKVDVDGQFGAKTYEAVVNFQKEYGLTPDGVVGPNTWKILKQADEQWEF